MTDHKVKILKFTGADGADAADTKESDDTNPEETPRPEVVRTAGQRLGKARTEKHLTVDQVATELNLSADIIRAIEEDDYPNLPEPTYTQGYLRAYARIVDVPESDVIDPSTNPSLTETDLRAIKPARSVPGPRRRKGGLGMVLFALLALVIGAAGWMGYQQEWFTGAATPKPATDAVRLGPADGSRTANIPASEPLATAPEAIKPGSERTVSFGSRTATRDVATGTSSAAQITTDQSATAQATAAQVTNTSAAQVVSAPSVSAADVTAPTVDQDATVVSDTGEATTTTTTTTLNEDGLEETTIITTTVIDAQGEQVETEAGTITIVPAGTVVEVTEEITTGEAQLVQADSVSDAAPVIENSTVATTVASAPASAVVVEAPTVVTAPSPADSTTVVTSTQTTTESESTAVASAAALDDDVIGSPWPVMVMKGSDDAWVEITDASGTKVFFDMVKKNDTRRLAAEPPLKILIGNAPGVDVTYEGVSIDIKGAANANNVTRMTLGE